MRVSKREVTKLRTLLVEENKLRREAENRNVELFRKMTAKELDVVGLKKTIKELGVDVCSNKKALLKMQNNMKRTTMELEQSRATVKKLRQYRNNDKEREKTMKKDMLHMKMQIHKLKQSKKRIKAEAKRQALEALREKDSIIEALQHELRSVSGTESDSICRICFDRECDVTIDPCGHQCCAGCLSKMTKCPYCRACISSPRL